MDLLDSRLTFFNRFRVPNLLLNLHAANAVHSACRKSRALGTTPLVYCNNRAAVFQNTFNAFHSVSANVVFFGLQYEHHLGGILWAPRAGKAGHDLAWSFLRALVYMNS